MMLPGFDTGGGALPYDLEMLLRLSEALPDVRNIVGIGNAFGYSTTAIALLFPAARVTVIDAEAEGRANRRGSNITRSIAATRGLNVSVLNGFSPFEVPGLLSGAGVSSPIDIAFIDGLHTMAQQYMDFHVLWPRMRPERHVIILHDVRLCNLERSLDLIREHYAPGNVREYAAVNGCNLFGTHIATPREGVLSF